MAADKAKYEQKRQRMENDLTLVEQLYNAGVLKNDEEGIVHVVDDPNDRVKVQVEIKPEKKEESSSFDFINSGVQPPGQVGSSLDDGHRSKGRVD